MKCQIKPVPHSDSCFILQFDRRLPQVFPSIQRSKRPSGGRPPRHPLSYPPLWRQSHAKFLAKLNRGQVPFELKDPNESFLNILEALSATDGLVAMADLDPYTIGITVAGLFSPSQVGEQVAALYHKAFYAEESFEFLHVSGFETHNQPASEPTATENKVAANANETDDASGDSKRNEKEKR